jgi:DNA-binding transcriptional ArsR family regulator
VIDDTAYRAAMHPVRLPILLACSGVPQSVDDLGLSEAEARWHLAVLEEAGLLARDDDEVVARADWRPLLDTLEAIIASASAHSLGRS